MKKPYIIFLVLIFSMACSNDFNEMEHITMSTSHNTSNNSTNGTTTVAGIDTIVWQLVTSYKNNALDDSFTLNQKITFLDSISNSNNSFVQLKPITYTTLTPLIAQKFLSDHHNEFNSIEASIGVKNYYNQMLDKDVDWDTMLQIVTSDNLLNTAEKSSLIFIINVLKGNPPYDDDDDMWKKNKIVAAHLGFNESSAQAVFNVALVVICQP